MRRLLLFLLFDIGLVLLIAPGVNYLFPPDDLYESMERLAFVMPSLIIGTVLVLGVTVISLRQPLAAYIRKALAMPADTDDLIDPKGASRAHFYFPDFSFWPMLPSKISNNFFCIAIACAAPASEPSFSFG